MDKMHANNFGFLHDATTTDEFSYSLYLENSPFIFEGQIVHIPTWIETHNMIHHNPPPVFVPTPSVVILLCMSALILLRRIRYD